MGRNPVKTEQACYARRMATVPARNSQASNDFKKKSTGLPPPYSQQAARKSNYGWRDAVPAALPVRTRRSEGRRLNKDKPKLAQ